MQDHTIMELIDSGWRSQLTRAVCDTRDELILMSPFIQEQVIEDLLHDCRARVRVLTRFSMRDFYEGVSNLGALRLLLARGARIKGVKHLHAKVYVFDQARAIITSANLTQAALSRNHELGLVTTDRDLVAKAHAYFEALWTRAGNPLTTDQLTQWQHDLDAAKATNAASSMRPLLVDHGADLGFTVPEDQIPPLAESHAFSGATQWFVKFYGTSEERRDRSIRVIDDLPNSPFHSICGYPKGKRPRRVKDGAVMFMGMPVKAPDDIMIIGRARGTVYRDGIDDLTEADKKHWPLLKDWPHFVRVSEPELMDATFNDGVSLQTLMSTFGAEAFVSTNGNLRKGSGNTNPRNSLRQPDVELTERAAAWLSEQLRQRMHDHGRLTATKIRQRLPDLDWPSERKPGAP